MATTRAADDDEVRGADLLDDLSDDDEPDDSFDEDVRSDDTAPEPFVPSPRRHVPTVVEMLVSSLLSLVASLVLSIEAIRLAENPLSTASCDISSKISCSVVGLSWQAQLLGFPNAFLGLVFEPIVLTTGIALLGGVRFPRWFMLGAQGLYTIAIGFAYWLFLQAYFVINALCPWCLLVTVTTTLVFMSLTRINILEGNIRFGRFTPAVRRYVRLGADVAVSAILIATILAMVVFRYL